MLAWLVDVVNMFSAIDPMPIAFPSDFDSDINLAKTKFTVLVELANCDEDTEKIEAQLEVSVWIHLYVCVCGSECGCVWVRIWVSVGLFVSRVWSFVRIVWMLC